MWIGLGFKTSPSANLSYENEPVGEHIFIRIVSREDSFWQRGKRQLSRKRPLVPQSNTESNVDTTDNSPYPYQDVGGIQVSGKTAEM